jgi:hypothetical protein
MFERSAGANSVQILVNAQNCDSIRGFAMSSTTPRRRIKPLRRTRAPARRLNRGARGAQNRL